MAFDDRDTSTPRTGNLETSVEEIVIKRNRTLPGIQLEISVAVIVDGVWELRKVPAPVIDSAWPGSSKSLKEHLLSIIDAAE